MKPPLLPILLFISSIFLSPAFAQGETPSKPTAQQQMDNVVFELKAKARKALLENAELTSQNEALLRSQDALEKELTSLQKDWLKTKNLTSRYQKGIDDIDKKKASAERYFNDIAKKNKTFDVRLKSLKDQLLAAQKQSATLQKEADRLQAQKQSLEAYDEEAKQKTLSDEKKPVVEALEALTQKVQSIQSEQENNTIKKEQFQKAIDLILKTPFENQKESDETLTALSKMLKNDSPTSENAEPVDANAFFVVFIDGKKLDDKTADPTALIKELEKFSQNASPSSTMTSDQFLIQEKKNFLIDEIKGLKREAGSMNDVAQGAKALRQFIEAGKRDNEKLQEKIAKLNRSAQEIWGKTGNASRDARNSPGQNLVRQKLFFQEQIRLLKKENKRISDELNLPGRKRQEMILKSERQLQGQFSDLEAEHKLLSDQVGGLNEKIAKIQKEKDFLETLLKKQTKSDSSLKDGNDSFPGSPPEDAGSSKSLWKVPAILKE